MDTTPKINMEISNLSDILMEHSGNVTQSESLRLYQISTAGVVLLSVAYGMTCVVAVVVNTLVLWLVLPSRRMWTVTNLLIANLAGVDLILAVFTIPFQIQAALLQRWILPHILCSICPFVQVLCITVNVWTLSVIAIHRYRVLTCPLVMTTAQGAMNIVKRILLTLWSISTIISLPTYFSYSVVSYFHQYNETVFTLEYSCEPAHLPPSFSWYYSQFLVCIQYVLPMFIITGAYSKMGYHLWKVHLADNLRFPPNPVLQENRRTVAKTMTKIVILFTVNWFPYQLYNFLSVHLPRINEYSSIHLIWFASHWLAMSSSCCNPFVYAVYDVKFQREFRKRIPWLYQYYLRWRRNRENACMYEMHRRRIQHILVT